MKKKKQKWNIGDLILYRPRRQDKIAYGIVLEALAFDRYRVQWFDTEDQSIECPSGHSQDDVENITQKEEVKNV